MSIRFLNLPATEAWKEMMKERKTSKFQVDEGKELDVEELKVIYKVKEDGESAVLYDLYDESSSVSDNCVVVSFSSVYCGIYLAQMGEGFVNVPDTSNDKPKGGGSWLNFYWAITGIEPTTCSSDGNTYQNSQVNKNAICNNKFCPVCRNKYNLVGAHIQTENNLNVIGIVPLCDMHNHQKDSYMIFKSNTVVVQICEEVNLDVDMNK